MEHLAAAFQATHNPTILKTAPRRRRAQKGGHTERRRKKLSFKLFLSLPSLSLILILSGLFYQHTPAQATETEPTLNHVDGAELFTHHKNPMSYMRFMHYRNSAGQVAYCTDYDKGGPADGGTFWDQGADAIYGPLEYYVSHGYPATTYISGQWWSADEAETLTQLAIWIHRGGVGLDGTCVNSEGQHQNMHNIDGDPRDSTLFEAAVSFYYEGISGYTPYGLHFCYLWKQPNTATQNMLVGIVYNGTNDFTLKKVSSDSGCTTGNDNYSFAGAVYGIYSDEVCSTLVQTVTLDEKGEANIPALTPGPYYIKELSPPMGYKPNNNVVSITALGDQSLTTTVTDDPWMDQIKIQKADSWTSLSQNNTLYSLAGAEFDIVKNDPAQETVATLVTDETGSATSAFLPLGDYQVVEKKAPLGYAIAKGYFSCTLTQELAEQGIPYQLDVPEAPQYDPGEMLIQKNDAETGDEKPLGGGSLAGAHFKVSFFASCADQDNLPETPTRSWTLKTDKDGKTSLKRAFENPNVYLEDGPSFYLNEEGKVVFPLGVVKVEETKAPEGYMLPERTAWYYTILPTNDGVRELHVVNTVWVPESLKRGELEFIKAHGETMARMRHIPFKITSLSTDESHLVTTDENGHFSTESSNYAHSENTNVNDGALDGERVDEAKLDDASGTWFYGHTDPARTNPINDEVGALPYDTYRIQELPCSQNEGLKLVDVTATVSRDKQLVKFGTIDDDPEDPVDPEDPPAEERKEERSSSEKLPKTGIATFSVLGLLGGGAASTVVGVSKFKKAHPAKNPNGHVW